MMSDCEAQIGYVSTGRIRWARGRALEFHLPIVHTQYDLTGKHCAFRLRTTAQGDDIFRVTSPGTGGHITFASPGATGQQADILIPWSAVSEHNGTTTLTAAVGIRQQFYFSIDLAAAPTGGIDLRVQGDLVFPPDTGSDTPCDP